jgi:hypothetical protein
MKNSPDMVVMKRDAEVIANYLNDAGTRPQFVGPAVRLWALQQECFEATMLIGRQARRWTGMRSGGQAVWLFNVIEPAVDAGAIDAQDTGHGFGAVPFVDGLDRASTPSFQFRGCSDRSTHV